MAGPVVDEEYLKEIERAQRDLRVLISSKNCAAIMLRLAWHDVCKYDKTTKIGGPHGSIRFEEEYNHISNAGLKIAIDLLEPIKEKHRRITYADLYQLAGVVAVEVTGGPSINFAPGRWDSSVPVRLLDAKQVNLRDLFYNMGLSNKDIVALFGSHSLAKNHAEMSGVDGVWLKKTLKFDNSYFIELLKRSPELLKPFTEKVLVEDPAFRPYVQLYAEDEETFLRDYAEVHKRFSEFGLVPPSISKGAKCDLSTRHAVRVSFAVAVVILCYVCKISRKK